MSLGRRRDDLEIMSPPKDSKLHAGSPIPRLCRDTCETGNTGDRTGLSPARSLRRAPTLWAAAGAANMGNPAPGRVAANQGLFAFAPFANRIPPRLVLLIQSGKARENPCRRITIWLRPREKRIS